MQEITFSTLGISKLLQNLNPAKACGPDQNRPIFLKELHLELAPIVQILFQRSYDAGKLPTDWTSALVTPLFKKGIKSKASYYRPISLTAHIIVNLVKHLESNNIW